jgi:transcriptional regulator GlxA family with amidase domain
MALQNTPLSEDFPVNSSGCFSGSSTLSVRDNVFLQKVEQLVFTNLDNTCFGNTQLAEQMYLSQSQLFRKLKVLTGQSVAVHIRSIRLRVAQKMLQTTTQTVSSIAYETGFTSPCYFSNSFSKEFGIAPSRIRE